MLVRNTIMAAGGGIQPLSAITLYDFRTPPVTASSSITFNTDGTITITGNSSSGPSKWYFPTTTGIGSSYYIKFVTAGGPTWNIGGLTSGTIYQLSSSRVVGWSASSGNEVLASANVYIYSNAGGTNQVATASIDVDVASL